MVLKVLALLALLAASSAEKGQSRWSRQISSYTSDISDWVPLSGPVEKEVPQIRRQAVAEPRIMTEPFPGIKPTGFNQDTFPSRAFYNSPANRQLYLQSVPSAPQNYLSEQGFSQGLRFGLAQPNFPLSQGFVTPQFNFENIAQIKHRPQIVTNPVKFENSPLKANPSVASPLKPFINQSVKTKPDTPRFVDGYRVENGSDFNFAKKPQSLQKIKFEHTDKSKEIFGGPNTQLEREEVQLLYVPLESLNRGQFNFRSPLTSPQLLNTELYNQRQNLPGEFQSPIHQQMDTFNSQEYLTNFNSKLHGVDHKPKFSTITTPFSTPQPLTTPRQKKLKPHQPPLAIFLTHDSKKEDQVKVGDVLHSLKSANTVAVLDSVNSLNAPKVFIGPSTMSPPENYVKFELPYLSNIDNIDKKLRQLPFFVAPLSYNTPQGFAKIPFPSPHVGSVVINSFIKDTTSANKETKTDIYSNPYAKPAYVEEQKPVTQKPIISYYSTSSPKINPSHYEQNYYSIEPQAVSTIRPPKQLNSNIPVTQSTPYKAESYFLSNLGNQYNPSPLDNHPPETKYNSPKAPKEQSIFNRESTTTPRIMVTTKSSSTYPSHLLETHNPYSINQAFHFSTPLDYHNFFDEYKEPYEKPELNNATPSPPRAVVNYAPGDTTEDTKSEQLKLTNPSYQTSPNYIQSYTPEIHHESEIENSRYTVFNTNDYFTKTAAPAMDYTNSEHPDNSEVITKSINNSPSQEYTGVFETQSALFDNYTAENNLPETLTNENQLTNSSYEYNQYDAIYNSQEILSSTSSTTTSTTKPPIRSRGRPRYPVVKSEYEHSTRAVITKRPLRERKPLPTRSRYESNKFTTETPTIKPLDISETTTKATRTRTRGRVHYKPSDTDDIYSKRNKPNSKENDLAYQRDILHQNYPVTLMERASTVDIEAITEPSDKTISTDNNEIAKADDTEDAYSHDKFSITGPISTNVKELPEQYKTRTTTTHFLIDEPYESKSGNQPQDSMPSNDEEDSHLTQSEQKTEPPNSVLVETYASNSQMETKLPIYSSNDDLQIHKQEDITISPEGELETKLSSPELSQEQEVNVVETTPSYNRVRVRPGVVRQYHQASTESSKSNRRNPLQAVTYRPAFDRRRTTMRIEEIEADLKTKQVHGRPEFQNYRQPVYKPEPSVDSSTPLSTTESSAKRGQLKRKRPGYVTTTTEGTKRPYEFKNRFRGRRPTEKPTEKPDTQTDSTSTTVKNQIYSRYSHRPRLSERYNKKPETEEQVSEDQDSNYSINRPKYVVPDTERWSAKISVDSFKPYNPNVISDEIKITSSNNNKSKDDQLDIITARNEYEDILISVTPAYNNRVVKKIPDIPPTLEALVEQSKVTNNDSSDNMSTFESMLEEVMKSLEEQDENEYTSKVMKHKGGEIGEIPPEKIITSGDNYSLKSTTPLQEPVTLLPDNDFSTKDTEEVPIRKNRRRGFWKKVKVRPITEEIDAAESQYYPQVVNRLGQYISKNSFKEIGKGKTKIAITTYKPSYQFPKDVFETDQTEDALDMITNIDIPKITKGDAEFNIENLQKNVFTTKAEEVIATEKSNHGDIDLGTGTPDPTFDDSAYYSEPTEPASSVTNVDRSDGFSLMDYFFGITSPDYSKYIENNTSKSNNEVKKIHVLPKFNVDVVDAEVSKIKATTESSYVPEEITAETISYNNEIATEAEVDLQREKVESSSMSSFMNPANVISTSMSTEVSHETEICFRGKCIKTNKDIL